MPAITQVMVWNCNGIQSKKITIEKIIETYDILCLGETKLENYQDSPEQNGFNLIRQDKNTGFKDAQEKLP